jgi:hypothetical protein
MLESESILMIHELRVKDKSIRAISQEIGHSLPLFPKKHHPMILSLLQKFHLYLIQVKVNLNIKNIPTYVIKNKNSFFQFL